MDSKLPYYMAYPMPLLYDDEKIEKRDFEYMKSMYPMTAKRILPYVEEECDRMEYTGSVIYDEYPDQLQIRMMCNRVYDKVKDMADSEEELWGDPQEGAMWGEMRGEMQGDPPGDPQRNPRRNPQRDRLRDLIQVLLFQELFRRRNDHRRRRRRFY
ncbi:MAG: hypothetical protein IJ439_01470 [Tyzzerella sp.]|nr:hypothetical protein [Tyzzerella sp.]